MTFKIGIINLLLAVVLLFMLVKTIDVWRGSETMQSMSAVTATNSDDTKEVLPVEQSPSADSFNDIVKHNLFTKSRSDYTPDTASEEKQDVVIVENTIAGKPIILYGVILMDAYSRALISNPDPKPGDPPNIWVKQGDRMGTLMVAGIEKEAVIFQEGDNKYKILIQAKEHSPSGSISVKRETPTVITTAPEKKETPAVLTTTSPDKSGALSPTNKPQVTDDDYETISTPFGSIKRRKNQ